MSALWAHRRRVLSFTLCLVVILFAAVMVRAFVLPPATAQSATLTPPALAATATPAGHPTYLFSIASFPPGPLRAGQKVQVRWEASYAPRTTPATLATGPVAITCTFALYGPYDAVTAARQEGLLGEDPATKPAFTAPLLTLTDWDSAPQQVEIAFPTQLPTGSYVVMSRSVRPLDGSSAGSGFTVEISA